MKTQPAAQTPTTATRIDEDPTIALWEHATATYPEIPFSSIGSGGSPLVRAKTPTAWMAYELGVDAARVSLQDLAKLPPTWGTGKAELPVVIQFDAVERLPSGGTGTKTIAAMLPGEQVVYVANDSGDPWRGAKQMPLVAFLAAAKAKKGP